MSKYIDEFEQQYKDLKKIREATKSVIKSGGDIAFKEILGARSVERIRRELKSGNK